MTGNIVYISDLRGFRIRELDNDPILTVWESEYYFRKEGFQIKIEINKDTIRQHQNPNVVFYLQVQMQTYEWKYEYK